MIVPFIKLYKLCTGYYFYDVGKNCILSISSTTYERLQELCKYGYEEFEKKYSGSLDQGYLTVKKLIKNNYLSNKKPTKICHPYTEYAGEYLDKCLNHIILQVTQSCNFKCDYCPYSGTGMLDRAHDTKFMTFNIAKKAIDLLINNSIYSDKLSIGFYGGEPLINFKLIQDVVNYIDEKVKDKEVSYAITTNGYLINQKMIDFFKMHKFSVTVSFDGPKEIHNKNRRLATNGSGTYDHVYENMKLMKESGLEFGINAVWDTEVSFKEINDYFSTDSLYEDIGYHIEPVLTGRIDTAYSVTTESEYEEEVYTTKAWLSFLGLYGELTMKEKEHVGSLYDTISKQIIERDEMPDVFHHGGPCIPGYLRLFVDVNGNFYPCEKISGKSEVMKIGNIENGFDIRRVKEILNIGKVTEEECKSCWAMNLCGICGMWTDSNESCFCKKMKLNRCNYIRRTANNNIINYIIIAEIRRMINNDIEVSYE